MFNGTNVDHGIFVDNCLVQFEMKGKADIIKCKKNKNSHAALKENFFQCLDNHRQMSFVGQL